MNTHKHTASCRKTVNGKFGCRYGFPQHAWNMATYPIRLDRNASAHGAAPRAFSTLYTSGSSPFGPGTAADNSRFPYPRVSPDLVTWAMFRPSPEVTVEMAERNLQEYVLQCAAAVHRRMGNADPLDGIDPDVLFADDDDRLYEVVESMRAATRAAMIESGFDVTVDADGYAYDNTDDNDAAGDGAGFSGGGDGDADRDAGACSDVDVGSGEHSAADVGSSSDEGTDAINATFLEDDAPAGVNTRVVTWSGLLMAATQCNEAVYPLWNTLNAIISCFYVFKYVSKNDSELAQVLSLLIDAKKHTTAHPSTAEDAGVAADRPGKYLLSRLLNSICAAREVEATTVASFLLGYPAEWSSHQFWFCFVRPAVTYALENARRAAVDTQSVEVQDTADVDADVDDDDVEEQQQDLLDADNQGVSGIDDDGCCDGTADVFTTANNGSVLATQHLHYRCRGPLLMDMCFYEFCALIDIVPIPKNTVFESGDEVRPGRKSNGKFQFSDEHPLVDSHMMVLRSKHKIPILAGPPAPGHPGPQPKSAGVTAAAWRARADAHANFYLTLFVPWNVHGYPDMSALNWGSFCDWYACDDSITDGFVARCRRECVLNIQSRFMCKTSDKKVLNDWRNRSCTQWGVPAADLEACEYDSEYDGDHEEDAAEYAGLVLQQLRDVEQLSKSGGDADAGSKLTSRERSLAASLEYYRRCLGLPPLVGTFSRRLVTVGGAVAAGPAENFQFDLESVNACDDAGRLADAQQAYRAMGLDDFEDAADAGDDVEGGEIVFRRSDGVPMDGMCGGVSGGLADLPTVSTLPGVNLDADQNRFFLRVVEWYNATVMWLRSPHSSPYPEPLKLVLSGGGGTGKSFVARALRDRLPAGAITFAATTGVAASIIPGARTLHSLLKVIVKQFRDGRARLPPAVIGAATQQAISANIPANCLIVCVDEMSMLTEQLFGLLDTRLRQSLAGRANTNVAREFAAMSVILVGDMHQIPAIGKPLLDAAVDGTGSGLLFRQFEVLHLKTPHRCEGLSPADVAHRKQLEIMRNRLKQPVTSEFIASLRTLSVQDVQDDPTWADAVVLVGDNRLRNAINRHRIAVFARDHGVPVLQWRLPIQTAATNLSDHEIELIYSNHPELTVQFVANAPAMILENINARKGLANGTSVRYHSVQLNEREDSAAVNRALRVCPPGEVVELEYAPAFVFVSVAHIEPAHRPTGTEVVVDDGVEYTVLPVKPYSSRWEPVPASKVTGLRYQSAWTSPSFALTYHKAQGMTLGKVIVDLTAGPTLRLATFYVAMSRVQSAANIRILPMSSVEHLKRMKHSKQLVTWMGSLKPVGTGSPFLCSTLKSVGPVVAVAGTGGAANAARTGTSSRGAKLKAVSGHRGPTLRDLWGQPRQSAAQPVVQAAVPPPLPPPPPPLLVAPCYPSTFPFHPRMINPRNHCFAHAGLQALLGSPTIRGALLDVNACTAARGRNLRSLVWPLHCLVQALADGSDVTNLLHNFKLQLPVLYQGGSQEDSGLFTCWLLTELDAELDALPPLAGAVPDAVVADSDLCWGRHIEGRNSAIRMALSMQTRVLQTCGAVPCGATSSGHDQPMYLHLDIRGHDTLHQCLLDHFVTADRDGYLEACCRAERHVPADTGVTMSTKLTRYPGVLVIALKRWAQNNVGVHIKDRRVIHFDPLLSLRPHHYADLALGSEYYLVSTCEHSGATLNGGHYKSTVLSPETDAQGNAASAWVSCDDGHVTRFPEATNAYPFRPDSDVCLLVFEQVV